MTKKQIKKNTVKAITKTNSITISGKEKNKFLKIYYKTN